MAMKGWWAGKDLYCVIPTMTWDPGPYGLIQRPAQMFPLATSQGTAGLFLPRFSGSHWGYIEMNGPNINSWFKNSQRSQHIFGVVKGHIIIFSEVRGHSFFYNGQISLSVFTAIKSLVHNKGLRYIYLILMVLVHVPFMIFYRKSWTWNNLNILI